MYVSDSVWGETYSYAVATAAIATVLGIPKQKMTTLRGRLQHLRVLGVPNVPRSGSGVKIRYSFGDVFEILIALRLGRLNCTPRSAKFGAAAARSYLRRPRVGQLYLLILPVSEPKVLVVPEREAFERAQLLDEIAMVNLSRSHFALKQSLEKGEA